MTKHWEQLVVGALFLFSMAAINIRLAGMNLNDLYAPSHATDFDPTSLLTQRFGERYLRHRQASLNHTAVPSSHPATRPAALLHPRDRHYQEWKSRNNLVHVVSTNFQRNQGGLLHLGRTRLNLLKAFTIPSLKSQTLKEFLWLIKIDPDLDDELKYELVTSVQDMPNVVVVAAATTASRSAEDSASLQLHHSVCCMYM